MRQYLTNLAYLSIFYACCWFCLWIVSLHFIKDYELACLLFPSGLRIGALLHSSKKYWLAITGTELALIIGLSMSLGQPDWIPALLSCLSSVPVLWSFYLFYQGDQWQHLCVIGLLTIIIAASNTLLFYFFTANALLVFLSSITGGLILVPACYLLSTYLRKDTWAPLTARVNKQKVNFRSRHLSFYLLIFVISILTQAFLPDEFAQFAPFCLAIPIILLAYQYGWQGALLATLFNSISLAIIHETGSLTTTDLLLSLSTQTLTGILLGSGVQRQRELNIKLLKELARNQSLSKRLITTEEKVRTDIARELHDEIGQNITAIRIQANILQRLDDTASGHTMASTIEHLSLNIYDKTRGLLNRLRPKSIDDLGLEKAIIQLINELGFNSTGVAVELNFKINERTLKDIYSITLYRICQEALNNIAKYAKAETISLNLTKRTISDQDYYCLEITDDGTGFGIQENSPGFGLRGIQERVSAIGGNTTIKPLLKGEGVTRYGTRLSVSLPIENYSSIL